MNNEITLGELEAEWNDLSSDEQDEYQKDYQFETMSCGHDEGNHIIHRILK